VEYGLVIGTYASYPLVHIHLEMNKRLGIRCPILVHDDCSPQQADLRMLCTSYGVAFLSTNQRQGHYLGDLSCILSGISWAKDRGLSIVVKMSRRFVPITNWASSLAGVYDPDSPIPTYGNWFNKENWRIRTDCFAMNVGEWGRVEPDLEMMAINVKIAKGHSFCVEKYVTKKSRQICQSNPLAIWDYVARGWKSASSNFIFHMQFHKQPTHGTLEYVKIARSLGLGYQEKDLIDAFFLET
jgi:hypothetical protein